MPTPSFYAKEEFFFEGSREDPAFSVASLARLPETFQSYPRVKLLPMALWSKIFDANDEANVTTNPKKIIVNRTVADVMAEDPGTMPRMSPSGPAQRENLGEPVPTHQEEELDVKGHTEGLAHLGLPRQAVEALTGAGYKTLDQILAAGEEAILSIKGVGPGSIEKLFRQ